MTVREYAHRFGLSVSAVYYRIRKGIIKAFKRGRRWHVIPPEEEREKKMDWHPQVHRRTAEADGLKPEDFNFEQWPVSNVRIEPSNTRHAAFWYACDIAPGTPQDNQYTETGDKLPDPVGMCLQSIEFILYTEDGQMLDEQDTLPSEGIVRGKPRDRSALWNRLLPDTTIKVKLGATPDFYYLSEDGGMQGQYAATADGQFKGKEVESAIFTLIMDHHGNVTVK